MGEVKNLQAFRLQKARETEDQIDLAYSDIHLTIHPRNRTIARLLRRLARRLEREPMGTFDESKLLGSDRG